MIRGYVAVLDRDSPLPDLPHVISSCRRAAIRLVRNENNHEFDISVEGTDYSFKVVGNIRSVDKHNIDNGLVRIGFIRPNHDIVISCNPGDLKAFVYTVEAAKDIQVLPPQCCDTSHEGKLKCICQGPKFAPYQRFHRDYGCPFSVLVEYLSEVNDDLINGVIFDNSTADMIFVDRPLVAEYMLPALCTFCCYRILEDYNDDDAHKILKIWKPQVFADSQMLIHSITLTSYTFLREICASGNNLVEFPEAIGSLPCLAALDLSENRLGQATNWNWLTSPFIRENLRHLCLAHNRLSIIPKGIGQLKNLTSLDLNGNYLTELPAVLGNLKYLRWLNIGHNKIIILPTWMYRKERFLSLNIDENDFMPIAYWRTQLSSKDFHSSTVPSLFHTVANYIIANKLAFWEHNIPATLMNYLEGTYYCRCGSVVFCDTIGPVAQCVILKTFLEEYMNDVENDDYTTVPIAIRYCSYKCYELFERNTIVYIVFHWHHRHEIPEQ